MDKEDVVQTYHEITFCYKKNDILSFAATWANLEGIMISGISQYRKTNAAWTHIEGIPPPKKKKRETA